MLFQEVFEEEESNVRYGEIRGQGLARYREVRDGRGWDKGVAMHSQDDYLGQDMVQIHADEKIEHETKLSVRIA